MGLIVLNESDIMYDTCSVTDDVGRVFRFDNRVFRGITKDSIDLVKEEFSSGLVQQLEDKELIPHTSISEYKSVKYPLILEHESMQLQIYGREMSFSMLRSCGELVLHLSKTLAEYGYYLKDCHIYNIMFDEGKPIYIDFGSIKKGMFSFPYYEFMEFYVFPLKVLGLVPTYANSFIRQSHSICLENYLNYCCGINHKNEKRIKHFIYRVENRLFANNKKALQLFEKRLKGIKIKSRSTQWGGYQDEKDLIEGANDRLDNERFRRFEIILGYLEQIKGKTVIEYGCNNGLLAVCAMKRGLVDTYYATDYDEVAIDNLYIFINKYRQKYRFLSKIYTVVVDFCEIHRKCNEEKQFKRFKSDVCIAMALTHHLLLSQFVPMKTMFKQFYDSTNDFLIVEFMPKGLWDGYNAPKIPDWYNKENFKKEMSLLFDIIEEEKLEENRIVFLSRKKRNV